MFGDASAWRLQPPTSPSLRQSMLDGLLLG
jgi:hypothetical protein